MSSRELANLVVSGISNGMDSLLVARHGRLVAEAYYAPFTQGVRHRINSVTKSVIGSLVVLALKHGLLKSLDQPVLDFFPVHQIAVSMSARNPDAAKPARHDIGPGLERAAARHAAAVLARRAAQPRLGETAR